MSAGYRWIAQIADMKETENLQRQFGRGTCAKGTTNHTDCGMRGQGTGGRKIHWLGTSFMGKSFSMISEVLVYSGVCSSTVRFINSDKKI